MKTTTVPAYLNQNLKASDIFGFKTLPYMGFDYDANTELLSKGAEVGVYVNTKDSWGVYLCDVTMVNGHETSLYLGDNWLCFDENGLPE